MSPFSASSLLLILPPHRRLERGCVACGCPRCRRRGGGGIGVEAHPFVGEGIEKVVEDYAAEVAKAMAV